MLLYDGQKNQSRKMQYLSEKWKTFRKRNESTSPGPDLDQFGPYAVAQKKAYFLDIQDRPSKSPSSLWCNHILPNALP